jgi:AcrR family transcriptional regulator
MQRKPNHASAPDSISGPSPQRPDNRRSQVIAAAARQLRENGYAATSMRKIASEAGILAGSIYYHFLSKEDLRSAVHDQGLKQINFAVRRAMDRETDPWLRLEAACTAHMAAILEDDDFAGVVLADISRVSPILQKLLNDQRNDYEQVFRQLINELDLPPDVDRTLFRLSLLGALNYAPRWYKPQRQSPAEIARSFVTMLRRGVE